jgi:hypothetical protein
MNYLEKSLNGFLACDTKTEHPQFLRLHYETPEEAVARLYLSLKGVNIK